MPSPPGAPILKFAENDMQTSIDDGHSHEYWVDQAGRGKTNTVEKHSHQIKDWAVSWVNDHIHAIPKPEETL